MGVIELDKEQAKVTATNQAVNGRDENGRFAIGNKPFIQTQKGGVMADGVKKIVSPINTDVC